MFLALSGIIFFSNQFVSLMKSLGWTKDEKIENVYFTFTVRCIVIDLFLNNQPDAPITQIYSVKKTLHISGNFFAHHQELSTVHSALVSFMQDGTIVPS